MGRFRSNPGFRHRSARFIDAAPINTALYQLRRAKADPNGSCSKPRSKPHLGDSVVGYPHREVVGDPKVRRGRQRTGSPETDLSLPFVHKEGMAEGCGSAVRFVSLVSAMTMGAQRADVLKMIVGPALTLTLFGVAAGVACAAGIMRLLSGMLYGIGPADAITFAATVSLLLLTSIAASRLPAYRAARVDPAQTIREQ
jgi:hypothetical protein